MLGNCVLRNPLKLDGTLDKGVFCESLLFFDKAHVVLDMGTLAAIVNADFLTDVIAMIKAGYLTGNFSPQAPVLLSTGDGGMRQHLFTVVKFGGFERKQLRNPEALELQLGRLINDKDLAKRYFRELCDLISFDDVNDSQIGRLGLGDLGDRDFAMEVARFALREKGIPEEAIKFSVLDILTLENNNFAIAIDIDFQKLRQFLPEPDRAAFGQNELFPLIGDVRFDLQLAASANAAVVGNQKHQTFAQMVLQRALGVSFDPSKPKQDIYDYVSLSTPSLREVINSGEKTPTEFLSLMEKSTSFRKWLAQQNPSADLIKEMLREKADEGWLERLPAKVTRFGIFSAMGMFADAIAPGASVGLGVVDNFLLDRLSKHWRPHYFVENDLRSFLNSK